MLGMDDEANFARRMAERRTQLDMTQSELARRMTARGFENYSQMTVSRTEKGERPIRLGEARALAELLGSNLEQMTRGTALHEFVAQADHLAEELRRSLSEVAGALMMYRSYATHGIDELHLMASLLGDAAERPEVRAALYEPELLRFPAAAVAKWAVEMATADSADLTGGLLTGHVSRLRELAREEDDGEPEATS